MTYTVMYGQPISQCGSSVVVVVVVVLVIIVAVAVSYTHLTLPTNREV